MKMIGHNHPCQCVGKSLFLRLPELMHNQSTEPVIREHWFSPQGIGG
ncbi:hypothetical protein EMIT0P260_50367 [Pseudomonas sp. IT-P260]